MDPLPATKPAQHLGHAALALGLAWGAAGWVVGGRGEALQLAALAVLIHGACLASAPWLATRRGWYATLVTLALAPLAVRAASLDSSPGSWLAAGVLASLGAHVLLAWRPLQAWAQRQAGRERLLGLLPQLQADKAAAEQARQDAEAANQAKTRFLAAASHDLRQPLHALGLFANALSDRSHEPAQQRLVDNIGEAVTALDDLFTELLDITRIDAGGVDVRPRDFPIESLWRRLRVHFEPVAFDKGLALTLRGGHHVAHADPVLVERILRNLTANAVRYTEDGGVLVAARRRGDRLVLQVWDSGVGIAPADQQRVFDEFAQVSGARRLPEPGRQRGLGLGLAIVRRLADLTQAPIHLKSVPGRGTLVSLSLPLGPRDTVPQIGAGAGLGATLNQRRIVVVDADRATRLELRALLMAWGAEVDDFDDAAACERWARQAGESLVRPDLLILGVAANADEHAGAAADRCLRSCFGAALPVLHIGGVTASSTDGSATPKDPERLAKPIQPNRLRAMIGFKLGPGSGDTSARDGQATV